MNSQIFREYDIRGITGRDLDETIIRRVGQAIPVYLRGRRKHNCVVVGRDGRLTSWLYSKALIDGLTSGGLDVIDIGEVPTPLTYFALFNLPVDGGIMITGSHNPKEYNGLKIAVGASTIHGSEIQKLACIAQRDDLPTARRSTTITNMDIAPAYQRKVRSIIRLNRKLKVVVDAGNGVGGRIAVPLLESLGCEVIPLFCEVDGNFPNHHPDPTLAESLEMLTKTVKKHKADCGIAFDGDADRIGGVDDKGGILWGDKLLPLFARSVLASKPGAAVIGEVKCSRTMYEDIERHGGKAIMWKTGHSLIKAAMREFNAELAGEMSGHIFFKHRWYGFDDAIYSGARLLEFISQGEKPLSEHLADIPRTYVTTEMRIETEESRKFPLVQAATRYFKDELGLNVNTIDGARIEFPDGWGLLRASNTSPVLVMRCEATTKRRLEAIRKLIEDKVNELNR